MSKKAILLGLTLAILWVPPCFAQVSFEYGAKVGLNYADIQTEKVGAGGRRKAPAVGVTFMVDPAGTLAFQSELLYMGKGDQDEAFTGEDGNTADVTVRIDYLELPLLAKLQAPLLGNSEASLFAGPALAFKINEELDDPRSARTVPTIAKRVDVGGTIGVEFGFGVGEGRLTLEARVTPGLMEISEGTYLRPESSNHVFSLMAGFVI